MTHSKFGVFVIGRRGELRSKSLQNFLSGFELHNQVTYIQPYSPSINEVLAANRVVPAHYLGGLSFGEVGCSMAHFQAQTQALDDDLDVSLFIEDDAVVPVEFDSHLISAQNFFNDAIEPRALSLFAGDVRCEFLAEQRTFESLSMWQFKSGVFPSFTVAYILNKPALRLSSNFSRGEPQIPVGKADFPMWAQRVAWYATNPNLVDHDDSKSTISDRPRQQAGKGYSQIRLILGRLVGLFLHPVSVSIPDRIRWELGEYFCVIQSRLSRKS
jgi:GR25 family glycosyltransferase involved in LPS biosynthesis